MYAHCKKFWPPKMRFIKFAKRRPARRI